MRTAGSIDEIHVDVNGLAVTTGTDRKPAVHLIEVQRPGALIACGPAHGLTRSRRDIELGVNAGGRNLGDLLDRGRQDTVCYQEDIAAETGSLVPRADLSDHPGGGDRPAARYITNRDHHVVELQVGALVKGDGKLQRGRVLGPGDQPDHDEQPLEGEPEDHAQAEGGQPAVAFDFRRPDRI